MKILFRYIYMGITVLSAIAVFVQGNVALAQSSSLFATPTTRMESRMPLTLGQTSFIAREIQPKKAFKEHDIVMVIVRDQYRNDNQADTERKRKMKSSYGVTRWAWFDGMSIIPSTMPNGSPTVAGEVDSQFKNKGKITEKQLLEFKISCRIVSICDNGLLYVEGTDQKTIGQDESIIDFSGYVREEDIQADNSVLKDRVVDPRLIIHKGGAVYDSYKLNWGQRLIDRFSPF